MAKVELTKQEIGTIIAFMERAQILGKEAYTFVPIVTKLMSALNSQLDKQAE
jgi:hypothetical protein